jgi:hypothetical protein
MPVSKTQGGGTMIEGAAIDGYRVLLLKSSLKLYGETGIKTHRGFRLRDLLTMASQITGAQYRNNKSGALIAAIDLDLRLKAARDLDTMGADVAEARQHAAVRCVKCGENCGAMDLCPLCDVTNEETPRCAGSWSGAGLESRCTLAVGHAGMCAFAPVSK